MMGPAMLSTFLLLAWAAEDPLQVAGLAILAIAICGIIGDIFSDAEQSR